MKFTSKFLTVLLLLHTAQAMAEVNFGPYLGQLIPLLPRETPSGRIFCGAVSENSTTIQKAFFVNESSVVKALEVCSGQFKSRPISLPWRKKYFITMTRRTDFPADGWITPEQRDISFRFERRIQRRSPDTNADSRICG